MQIFVYWETNFHIVRIFKRFEIFWKWNEANQITDANTGPSSDWSGNHDKSKRVFFLPQFSENVFGAKFRVMFQPLFYNIDLLQKLRQEKKRENLGNKSVVLHWKANEKCGHWMASTHEQDQNICQQLHTMDECGDTTQI